MHFKMWYAKRCPFWLGLSVLSHSLIIPLEMCCDFNSVVSILILENWWLEHFLHVTSRLPKNSTWYMLVQVMAWCCQTTSHYLYQCWLGVIRPQWVKAWWHLYAPIHWIIIEPSIGLSVPSHYTKQWRFIASWPHWDNTSVKFQSIQKFVNIKISFKRMCLKHALK